MKQTHFEQRTVRVDEMAPIIWRARKKAEFQQMKESIEELGTIIFPQCIDLGKKRADGVRYLIVGGGQGRWEAAKALKQETMPILIIDADKKEAGARFLIENFNRKDLTWAEKGRLIRKAMDGGKDIDQAAREHHIAKTTAEMYLRTLGKMADDSIEKMPLADAVALTALPARGQKIVIELARENGQPIKDVVKETRSAVAKGADWSIRDIKKAASAKDEKIRTLRKRVALHRLHYSLGPENLKILLKDKKFLAACKSEEINLAPYQQ